MGDAFVNEAISEAFSLYESSLTKFKDEMDSRTNIQYNSFLCTIIRMLVIIYGDDIMGASISEDAEAFNKSLMKYGMSEKDVNDFEVFVQRYYAMDKKHQGKTFRKKNKFFNVIQKYLIDMLVLRNNREPVPREAIENFYDLLFTANSKDFSRASTAVAEAFNPYQIDEYFKRQKLLGE